MAEWQTAVNIDSCSIRKQTNLVLQKIFFPESMIKTRLLFWQIYVQKVEKMLILTLHRIISAVCKPSLTFLIHCKYNAVRIFWVTVCCGHQSFDEASKLCHTGHLYSCEVLGSVSSKGVTYDQPLDTPTDLRQYLVGRKSSFIK